MFLRTFTLLRRVSESEFDVYPAIITFKSCCVYLVPNLEYIHDVYNVNKWHQVPTPAPWLCLSADSTISCQHSQFWDFYLQIPILPFLPGHFAQIHPWAS